MIGIIDVGGGLRGIYGAGVFDYCLDNNITFDYCIGVSAGSANIASYLAKQKGRNLKFYLEYPFRKKYMSFKNLITKGSYIDLNYIYGDLSISTGENPLKYKSLKSSSSIMKIVATNALTGEAVYFDKNDIYEDNYDILKASCCIPVICKPFFINNIPYFDGGLSDPIPIIKALSDKCDKVVIILTKPINYVETNNTLLIKLLSKKFPYAAESMANSSILYNESIQLAKEYQKHKKVIIIAPDDCDGLHTLTKSPKKLKTLYDKGYKDAEILSTLNFSSNILKEKTP